MVKFFRFILCGKIKTVEFFRLMTHVKITIVEFLGSDHSGKAAGMGKIRVEDKIKIAKFFNFRLIAHGETEKMEKRLHVKMKSVLFLLLLF